MTHRWVRFLAKNPQGTNIQDHLHNVSDEPQRITEFLPLVQKSRSFTLDALFVGQNLSMTVRRCIASLKG